MVSHFLTVVATFVDHFSLNQFSWREILIRTSARYGYAFSLVLVLAVIDIDLIPDLTVGAFVRCLKRFVDRKGLPSSILSDNGKTFKGKEVKKVLLKSGINWRFNLAKASWTGEFFERLFRQPRTQEF